MAFKHQSQNALLKFQTGWSDPTLTQPTTSEIYQYTGTQNAESKKKTVILIEEKNIARGTTDPGH